MTTNDTREKLIDKYRESMKVRNLAEKTITGNIRYLNKFFEYLEKIHGLTDTDKVTKEIIYEYQIYQYERINKVGKLNTVAEQNNALKPVKHFFQYLKEYGYIVSDPASDISYAKEPRRLPRGILTQSEARKILHAPDLKTATGYRNRTLMELLYTSGVRKGELINLKLEDVDYDDGILRIEQGKGKKDRIVPIGRIACRYLENYIKSVRPEFIKDPYNNYLFLSLKGNRLSRNTTWELIKKYAKQARIKKNVHPHTFRHSCATSMLKNKADIRSIQELLGHS
ncbi:MAG: tyrosine-type recombinase/integrase, partial [Planctomycetes bacterium]|nr:tyrosine-type recombinase/integrase [Planctomycetota bacterium]